MSPAAVVIGAVMVIAIPDHRVHYTLCIHSRPFFKTLHTIKRKRTYDIESRQ